MTRIVDPFRFHARAAVTDWMRISRARDETAQEWLKDWPRRKLDSTTVAQLRWSINPQLSPSLPHSDIGMPSGPFIVWTRQPSLKQARELTFFTYLNQDGATIVWWFGKPMVYVQVTLAVAGTAANVIALNGPASIDTIESMASVSTGSQGVVLAGTAISALAISSDAGVSVTKLVGVTAVDYANADDWRQLEIVGLPVDQGDWSDVERHAEKQGLVGALTTPAEAARDRLRRGAPAFGWDASIGFNPAPVWQLPDFDGLIKEVRKDLLPRLHPVMKMASVLQPRQRDTIAIPGPTGSGGTLSDPSEARLPPLGLTFVAAGSDPLMALTLGFGTAYEVSGLIGAAAPIDTRMVAAMASTQGNRLADFMVTANWDNGIDGQSAAIEMAALAIGATLPVQPPTPASLLAQVQSRDRPAAADLPWTSASRVSWSRLPRLKMLTTSSFAMARANPAHAAEVATAIMRERPSGGYAPITLTRNLKDKEQGRHSGVDSGLTLPMSAAGLAQRYGIALQDIWGLWSHWGTVDYTDMQPAPDRPRILKCALDAAVPGSGRICPGTLTIELAWDWQVRRPNNIELRCRLFAAPQRSSTPPPDLSLPAGIHSSMAAVPGAPLLINFSGDSATALPANVSVDYFDIDGHPVTPGPVGEDDVRRYKITISGFSLDYSSVGHVGVALWSRVQERAAPLRTSAWLAPLVSGSAIEPGPNVAYASDPIPPIPAPPELVQRASLADARGEHHARVAWAASSGAVGYFVYHSTESAILGAVSAAGGTTTPPAPDPTRTYTERLAVLRGLLAIDTHRHVFTRLNTEALKVTTTDLILPRGTREIHLYTMVAVNAGNIESAWPTAAEAEERILAIAAAGIVSPAAPRLEIRRVDRPAGLPKFAVHVDLTSQPGAAVSRYELYRTRVEAAAMQLDTMGPPVATIAATAGSWTVTPHPADPAALDSASGTDNPDGSWKKLWYRAVAWAHKDDDRALLPGRSPPSNAMSLVIPPDGPPNLSAISAEWSGGPLQDVLLHFTSSAPIAVTALGPHKLGVTAAVLNGPSKATQATLLQTLQTLDAIDTVAPAGTGLWRDSLLPAVPARYAVLLKRGSVDDQIGCIVRLADPLGRMTEQSITIAAGPVDPLPDVLDLQLIHVGMGINANWRSTAPPGPRAGGSYRIRITLKLPGKVIGPQPVLPVPPVQPVIRPRPQLMGRAALTAAGTSRGSVAAILHKPLVEEISLGGAGIGAIAGIGGIEIGPAGTKSITIEAALSDIPLSGSAPAPTPAHPWKLERQNSVHGSTSYSLIYNGKASSITVRITAPDGRFAEQVMT
ncbi:hypothetical protein [Actimicrobium antarcticum]|uniref:Uncharacterized protein n=1 Tax=Actimicrobium antarcticum TaxID=1051899 RepID=A0ABP7SKK6_9BURK